MALTGRRILITRTRRQASELAVMLEAEGAETILIPTIELVSPVSFAMLDSALASLPSFDWVLFTSANAVQAFGDRLRALGVTETPKKVAVIGPATARTAREIGLAVDLMPPQYVAEALAEALKPCAAGAHMLLVRAEEARDVLPDLLVEAGAQVSIAVAYRKIVPAESVNALRLALTGKCVPDAITFTSSSTATNLFTLLAESGLTLPEQMVRASIGSITSRTLRELGYPPTVEAAEPTVAALCQALAAHFR